MFKEMIIKGGLMVTALVVAETVIGKLEKRALKQDIDKVESEEEEFPTEEDVQFMKKLSEMNTK